MWFLHFLTLKNSTSHFYIYNPWKSNSCAGTSQVLLSLTTMGLSNLFCFSMAFSLFIVLLSAQTAVANSKLFREYIGAENKSVLFSDVPINPNIDFHFILSFAIDYTNSSSPSPTNGLFNIFWDSENLTPSQVSHIKSQHSNVRVALSLGGDSVQDGRYVYFQPCSIDSWVQNALLSVTKIIEDYNLDGIDIDYEHFKASPSTFAECIGRLIENLKQNGIIKFASIAPFEDKEIQSHYQALWRKYGHLIDYVNFQFYAYDNRTTVYEFLNYFETQNSIYSDKVLVSFGTDGSGGLSPENGFFCACKKLEEEGKLRGIFVWSADDSKDTGFPYEKKALALLDGSSFPIDTLILPCEVSP